MHMIASTKTYAQALFEVGLDGNKALDFYYELKSFNELLLDDAFYAVMEGTYLEPECLNPIWEGLNTVFSVEIVNFLEIVQDASLMRDFQRIIFEYRDFLSDNGYLNVVEVTSPITLSDTEKATLLTTLKQRYDGQFELEYEVDQSLISGLRVRINHDIFDTSIKHKLDRILNQGGLENE